MVKKANGSGSISFESARNKYRAEITDPQGKRITKRFSDKADAERWLTIIKADIYRNTYIPPSTITIGEWIMEYLCTYCEPNVRPKTMERYIQSAKFIGPIAEAPLQKLNAYSVQKFYNELPEMSDSSKNKIHKLLKAAITKAYQLDMIPKNFMEAVIAPKVSKKEIQIFTKEEIRKILDATISSQYYNKYYPLLYLAVTTGARLGEVLGLKYNCVKNGYIVINNSLQEILLDGKHQMVDMPPKTEAGIRKITINKTLQQLLTQKAADERIMSFDGYVFHTAHGTPYNIRNLRRMWIAVQKAADVPYRNFHCLRHTHATQLLAAGVPLLEVAKRLGHSKVSHTLNLYGHAIPGYDQMIPEKIDELLAVK